MRKNFSLDVTDPLDSQIATLCGRVEALVPGCRAGVCIASADHTKLERSVFPNLPPTFQQAIKELPMGPPYIGCCTAAMQGNQIITVHDLEKESRFSDLFIATCLSHGIRSLRSRPFMVERMRLSARSSWVMVSRATTSASTYPT